MGTIFSWLYRAALVAGAYLVLCLVINMLPAIALPPAIQGAVDWLIASLEISNWFLPMDTIGEIMICSIVMDVWRTSFLFQLHVYAAVGKLLRYFS